jgi:hypothetical protein
MCFLEPDDSVFLDVADLNVSGRPALLSGGHASAVE